MWYTQEDIERINSTVRLEDVLSLFGYEKVGEDKTRLKYLCPFHKDSNPSFSVSRAVPEGRTYQSYYCHACHAGGEGAVKLMQDLLRVSGENVDGLQRTAVSRLAEKFDIKLHSGPKDAPYEEFVDSDYRDKHTDYAMHYSSQRRDSFTPEELAALGLSDIADEHLSNTLHREFHCYAIDDCRYEGGERLWHAFSTPERPLFEFDYGTHIRKYDVNYTGLSNFKNTVYARTGCDVDYDAQIYGDQTLLDLISQFSSRESRTEQAVQQARFALNNDASALMEAGRGRREGSLLRRIVICSGQKDAINVFLRSDAHVIYPHSETSNKGLSRQLIETLLWLSNRVYVLFDSDKTGQTAQNALCLRHLDLRPITLPADLRSVRNHVTGKPCKDITEYFDIYCRRHHIDPEFSFRQMLRQAKDLKFWRTNLQRHRSAEPGEYWFEEKYELDAKSLARFLEANGFGGVWEKNANGVDCVQGYMHVGPYHCEDYELQPNVCKVIQLTDGYDYAFQIVQNFLRGYNLSDEESENLENALLTQRKVSDSSFRNAVSHAVLDVWYWLPSQHREADTAVWRFFSNAALRIEADSIEMVQYKDLPFLVNAEHIADFPISKYSDDVMQQFLHFRENPEYQERLKAYETAIALRFENPEKRQQLTKEFTEYERQWRYIPTDDYRTMTGDEYPIARMAHGQSRVYWKKEEDGYLLSADEKQIQFIYELNLMNAIGYMQCRWRTKGQIHFVLFSDYAVVNEQSASGGTGKSTWIDLLNMVMPIFLIRGNTMKTGDAFPKNFENYVHGKHSAICFDDWNEKLDGRCMNGMENGIDVRAIYQNTIHIPYELTPKTLITTNAMKFDVTQGSTYRRMYLCLISDYFHPEDSSGSRRERSYVTEFGHDPIQQATPEEKNAIGWFFALCAQTYLRIGKPLHIPVDVNVLGRTASAGIKSGEFINWAQQFFSQECHFRRPIAVSEMQLSFAQWMGADMLRTHVTAGLSQFDVDLHTYTHNAGIQALGWESDVVRGKATRKGRFPNRNCWVTQVDDHGYYHPEWPRVIEQTGCLYFFRSTDKMPRHHGELEKCGDQDPEAE